VRGDLHSDAVAAHHRFLLPRLLDGGPEVVQESLARHLEDVVGRVAGGRLEVGRRPPPELQDLQRLVDHDTRRPVALADHAIGFALAAGHSVAASPVAAGSWAWAGGTTEPREAELRPHRRRPLGVDPVHLVGHREQIRQLPVVSEAPSIR